MPNIRIKKCSNPTRLHEVIDELSRKIIDENGVIMSYVFEERGNGHIHIHYEWNVPEIDVIQEAQKTIKKMPGHMQAGTKGVQRISNGDVKRALKRVMEKEGIELKYDNWLRD